MTFELKEKVLAHHGPMIYEAKVRVILAEWALVLVYCSCG